jgi:hypothetical protein
MTQHSKVAASAQLSLDRDDHDSQRLEEVLKVADLWVKLGEHRVQGKDAGEGIGRGP